jgi:predicted ATPase
VKTVHITKIHLLRDRFPTREHYPFSLDVFNTTESLDFTQPVTFFVGENGTGKSTLLQAIARCCNIHIWKDEERTRYHYNKFEENLHNCLKVDWKNGKVTGAFFASEIFQHFSQILDEWAAADPGVLNSFGSESLMEKSHGQRHMAYFKNRFRIGGLYLLDEPENALSPKMQLALLELLRQMSSKGDAQFIIATHSPILLAYPDADIYSFDYSPIRKVRYEETDYYNIYKDFLNNRGRYLDGL